MFLKSKKFWSILIASILVSVCFLQTISFAAQYELSYCIRCDETKKFLRTNTRKITRTSNCTTHDNCMIVRHYQLYDLNCEACGYGGGAHGGEELISTNHQQYARSLEETE